jgi:capsular exopolysaccharide synthesis family protein
MEAMTPPAEQNDLRSYLRTLWRWKLLFLAFLIAAPVVSYFLQADKAKQYQSSTLLQIQGISLDSSLLGGQSLSSDNLQAIARLVTTRPIADGAAKLLHAPPGSLLGKAQATADTDTGFLTITVTDTQPARAAAIANAFASALDGSQTATAIAQLNTTIAGVKAQLSRLARNDTLGRTQLSDRLQQLRAARASVGHAGVVIERALPSSAPIGGSTRRAVELGLVIGLLLGLGAVVLAENADRRVRTPEDLEALSGVPLLSAIPSSAFSSRGGGDPRDDESFKRLRGTLMYFNVDRTLTSVVITSPGQQDGKTTVAVRLAVATARAGTRVILVEADLRRPQVAQRLGLDEHAEGLASVLAGQRHLSEVLIDYPLADDSHVGATAGGRLRVLPGGPIPPNPSELISSEKMQRLVADLEAQADLVLIDTPALLAVSDALPLLPGASGVVIVARLSRTTRAAIRRLQQIIATANGVTLGAVATGTRAREGYEGYTYGYYEHGGSSWRARRRARRTSLDQTPAPPDIPRADDTVHAQSPESRPA